MVTGGISCWLKFQEKEERESAAKKKEGPERGEKNRE